MNKNVELSSKLGDLLNVPPISIELLPGNPSEWLASAPPEHAPFLFVDNHLGVPHKLAYKAYLAAVARFRAVRPRHRATDCPDSTEVLTSSAVLLLVNPAHQTALNTRKRLVLLGVHPASHELRFTDALLTLRDGAKQSIVWHHRRWLLRHIHPLLPASASDSHSPAPRSPGWGDGVDTLNDVALPPDAFLAEIAAVERACEAYPRNYHAWAHRYLCAEALVLSASASSPHGGLQAARELEEERARIRTWVERHVADYSAMQYACRLEVLLRGRPGVDGSGSGSGVHALALVRAYPSHEALWLYLRGAVALGLFCPPEARETARAAVDVDELAEQHLTRTFEGKGGEGATAGSQPVNEARAHAVRFAAWRAWLREGRGIDGTLMRKIAAAAEGEVTVTSEGALLSYLSAGDAKVVEKRTRSV
ncbi:protein prenylyltransferase [Ganoderma leucocontextum]|nr:protein prenylyltransferase [Ganoderma leucocontextum]KAI1785232.1 protein prenylyltransferase [Ganoderma leucocontextum]